MRAWSMVLVLALAGDVAAQGAKRPNIVLILADDLGVGDVACLNAKSKIRTPNLDRLAREGTTFADAHSPSAVCTPTRYGLLTGRYAWRTRLKSGVLLGWGEPLIEPSRPTLASLLKRQGYVTACVGKWHLGLDWKSLPKGASAKKGEGWQTDYAKPFGGGPTSLGFDQFFGISASLDMPPYVYLEGDRATAIPTTEKTWVRKGPAAADFEAIDVLPKTTERAVAFIREQAPAAKKGTPFFLYFPLTSPHTPVVPTPEWKGKSDAGEYGDFVAQTDDVVGKIMNALETSGVANDTLVIFTSDNGAAPYVVVALEQRFGHFSSGSLRGYKADIWEGGHRVPFFARWPGVVPAGATSHETICHVDFLATFASLVGEKLPKNAGEDSYDLTPALRGEKRAQPIREAMVLHSLRGVFGIRQGDWMLCLGPDGGGFGKAKADAKAPPRQLYDLRADPSQRKNVIAENAALADRLEAILTRYQTQGASAPHARNE